MQDSLFYSFSSHSLTLFSSYIFSNSDSSLSSEPSSMDSVHDGPRFPIHPLIRHPLQATNLVSTQLNPNSYKYLVGSFVIWTRVHPSSYFTLKTLLLCYTFKKKIKWPEVVLHLPKPIKGLVTSIPKQGARLEGKIVLCRGRYMGVRHQRPNWRSHLDGPPLQGSI